MSPKIKMKDICDDRDDDITELSDEESKEIWGDDDFDIKSRLKLNSCHFAQITELDF